MNKAPLELFSVGTETVDHALGTLKRVISGKSEENSKEKAFKVLPSSNEKQPLTFMAKHLLMFTVDFVLLILLAIVFFKVTSVYTLILFGFSGLILFDAMYRFNDLIFKQIQPYVPFINKG